MLQETRKEIEYSCLRGRSADFVTF